MIAITVTTPPAVVTAPPAVVIPVNLSAVSVKLPLLITDLLIVLTGFAPIALAELAVTSLSQLLELSLITAQLFTLPVVARGVAAGISVSDRDHQRNRQ
jgi:hypothetical protein